MVSITRFSRLILLSILLGGSIFAITERVYGVSSSIVEDFYPKLSQAFPSDWEIIPIGAHSYKIIIGKKALDKLAQLAKEKIKEEKNKIGEGPTIIPFVERVSEGLKDLPEFQGSITGSVKITFTPPAELQSHFSELYRIAKKVHIHLVRGANSATWILDTGYSTLPDKEAALNLIEKTGTAIEENKDLALYIKERIPQGWDFSKINLQKVIIVLHFRDLN